MAKDGWYQGLFHTFFFFLDDNVLLADKTRLALSSFSRGEPET